MDLLLQQYLKHFGQFASIYKHNKTLSRFDHYTFVISTCKQIWHMYLMSYSPHLMHFCSIGV